MLSSAKQLYLFLTACSGNWRNSIYVKCQGENDTPGYLLAADRDGQPVILGIHQFYQLTGVWGSIYMVSRRASLNPVRAGSFFVYRKFTKSRAHFLISRGVLK